jgi:hypothetical protein
LSSPAVTRVDDIEILHWPSDYVGVALPDTPRELQADWEEMGYTFIRFMSDPVKWPVPFTKLGTVIGAPPPQGGAPVTRTGDQP